MGTQRSQFVSNCIKCNVQQTNIDLPFCRDVFFVVCRSGGVSVRFEAFSES